ncbi:hypothetical protein PSEUBRA_005800 [Kalmanozyma brasiliensis GHG001]|uniref:uncharacterized protein n=1 Tax=Kalmanozyma brasiliensis (strain GHG001) TaxID=1365824 RepID=UPI002867F320|nr:uncharacterized protein PSEUBRA_005800 [Kalmanozyma brasiliensis GHG001]KAF6767560.1 hypothetical protein PSEUBRA_005800 [Kalmanozyma brasiliensis GHG001]
MPSFKRLPTASAGIDASNAAAEKDTSTTGGSIERVGASSSSVERPHATTSKATRTSNAAPPRTVSSTAKRRSSLSMVSGRALPLIRPRRAFTAAISRRGSYCHRAPAGYAFSGPTDDSLSLQRQRRFVVPPGVTRVSYKDFPTLDLPLERGMHSHPTGCVECRNRNLHCTFGAGIRPNGKTRDPQNGRCDWCVFGSKKCVGNGYKGNTVEQKGAHETLAELLGRVEAQIDGCLRAGERDESMMGEASRIMGRIASVNLKLGRLEGLLREVKRSAMREGKVRVGSRGS